MLLRAALEGRLEGGLADDGLHEALELCLACKACATECPAQVDMARLKAEALAHRHRARGVPARARGCSATRTSCWPSAPARRALHAGRGAVAGRSCMAHLLRRSAPGVQTRDPDADMVVMADTFTRYIDPGIGDAALRVLRAAGVRDGRG